MKQTADEREREILRSLKPLPAHLWRREIMVGNFTCVQTFNFALCEAQTRAKAGINDGMEDT